MADGNGKIPMGAKAGEVPPDIYLEKFLEQLFSFAKDQPWLVF